MSGNYVQNGRIFNSDGMVVGQATDPNYNPGFFGWMWDGIKNPAQALNTFEKNVLTGPAKQIEDFLAPVQKPFDNFLDTSPAGQAIAPVLRTGGGYSTATGGHVGMAAPTGIPADQIDIDAIVDGAVQNFHAKQPGLAAPTTPQYSYNNNVVSKQEYDQLMGYDPNRGKVDQAGWNSATQAAQKKGANRLSDGTEYTTEVRNGQTIYTVVASPKNPSAVGKTMDESNFDRVLSGKSFTPIATPPANAGQPSPLTSGQPGYNPMTDPAVMGGAGTIIGGAISAGSAAAAGGTQAAAATEAARLQKESTDAILKMLQEQYNQQRTDQTPWREAGVGALGKLQTFEQDNPAFSMEQLEQDPGYTFRLNEGMKALQNSAAARGGLLSGNTLKGISNYGQESASQEYNNAYNRYTQQKGSRLNALQSLAGVGQTAVNQTQQAGQNYASGAGEAMFGGGNALANGVRGAADGRASGYIGTGNALNNAIGGYINYNQSQNFLNALTGGR